MLMIENLVCRLTRSVTFIKKMQPKIKINRANTANKKYKKSPLSPKAGLVEDS